MSLLADQQNKVMDDSWQTQKDAQSGAKLPQLSQLSDDLSTKLSASKTQQSN